MARKFTSDGKEIFLPNIFSGNVRVVHAGAGDDPINGRWEGQPFRFQVLGVAEVKPAYEWQFNDWVYIAGGYMMYLGADFGDEVSYDVYAPLTIATTGTTYDKQDMGGGLNRFKPDGSTHDIDLEIAVPVPSVDDDGIGTGYFNWDPDTNIISVQADGKGLFDLFDADVPIGYFIPKMQLLDGGKLTPLIIPLTVSAVKPKRLLAQWKHRLIVKNGTNKTDAGLQIVWSMLIGRKTTTT